jgi:phosphohistidine swiveling domain-containing protein
LFFLPEELDEFLDDPGSFDDDLEQRKNRMVVYRGDFTVLEHGHADGLKYEALRLSEPIIAVGGDRSSRLLNDLSAVLNLLEDSPAIDSAPIIGTPIYWRGDAMVLQGRVSRVVDPRADHVIPDSVLVATSTTPDFLPLMRSARAIVTDWGGQTSHAALTARELGIPCIVGTKNASSRLRSGDLVTLDFRDGSVLKEPT